ncbi:MAG: hypothetical protein DRQ44_16150, partial [Gammaproteobacteria bacterium]
PFQLPFLPVLKQLQFDDINFYYSDAEADIETDIAVNKLRLSNPGINETIHFSANGTVNQHPFEFSGETSFLTDVTRQNIADQGIKLKVHADAPGVTLAVHGEIEHPVLAEGINITFLLVADDLDKTFTSATGKSIYQFTGKTEQPLSLNFSARLTDIPAGYALNAIKLKLADSDISGKLSYIANPERAKITAELHSDKIYLNQLLAKQPGQSKQPENKNRQPENKNTTIKLPDTTLPFHLLKSLDADINYSIGQFQMDQFKPEAVILNATLHAGLLQIKQLDLKLDGAPVRSSLTIDSSTKIPSLKTTLDIDNLQLGLISQALQLEQLKSGTLHSRIKLRTRGKSIKSLVLDMKGKANIQLDDVSLEHRLKNNKHKAKIKRLKLDYSGINEPLKYHLNGSIDDEPLSLSGELDSPASFIDNKTLRLKLKLTALNADLEVDGSIAKPLDIDRAQLSIALDIPKPETSILKISHLVPKIKPNEKIPDLPLKLQGLLSVAPMNFRFEKMQLTAGNSDLSGTLFADLRGEKPFIDAKLESQLLDLNELVPATIRESDEAAHKTEKQQNDTADKTRLFSTEPLPALDALDKIDVKLIYKLKKLTSNNKSINNIYLNLTLKDSLLKLEPLSIDFARGTIKSTLELSSVNTPRFQLEAKIIKLDYDRLMAILGTKEYASGELDAEINLTGEGNSVSALMASLDGRFRVTTEGGVLHSDALKLLSKDIVSIIPFTDSSDRQKINCGVVQFDINKGIASTHAMVINTGTVSALGTGDIDLASETLSLYIAPRSKRTSILKLALVPVNVTGPLISPSVVPDIAGSAISTTETATNISLAIATGGVWLLAENFTNKLWDQFIDDTDYCAKALAGEKIVPARIKLESKDEEDDDLSDVLDDDENDWF